MNQPKPTVTIDQAFREFLAEQEARLSPATVSKYESILDLFRSCLERYWPGHDRRIRPDHRGRRHLLWYVWAGGHPWRPVRVPRLLHAAQGHRRQSHDASGGHGHEEAREVAGREGLRQGRRGRRIGGRAGQ